MRRSQQATKAPCATVLWALGIAVVALPSHEYAAMAICQSARPCRQQRDKAIVCHLVPTAIRISSQVISCGSLVAHPQMLWRQQAQILG